MPIQWKTDYAIRLMYEAALLGPGARATVRTLATRAGVPYDFARVIAHELVVTGLLASHRGVGGGVELGRAADEITLLDIFHALGEPPSLALCTRDPSVCPRSPECPMHNAVWSELDRRIAEYLRGITLAGVVSAGLVGTASTVR